MRIVWMILIISINVRLMDEQEGVGVCVYVPYLNVNIYGSYSNENVSGA